MIIEQPYHNYDLIENAQKWNIRMALAEFIGEKGNTLRCAHPYILCRDYWNDMILFHTFPDYMDTIFNTEIHGFNVRDDLDDDFNPMKKDYVLVLQRGTMDHDISLSELNDLEVNLNLKKTEIIYEDEWYYILKYDKKWIYNNFSWSAYTYLLRVACHLNGYKEYYLKNNFIDFFYAVRRYPKIKDGQNFVSDGILAQYKSPHTFIKAISDTILASVNYWDHINSEHIWNKILKALYSKLPLEYKTQHDYSYYVEYYLNEYQFHDAGFLNVDMGVFN
jgi:hypothetical protein